MDTIDRKILFALDQDARMPIAKIARKLRQSREKVNYRIQQLVDKGIIRKFVTMINPGLTNYAIYKFYFKFQNISKEQEQEVITWLVENTYVYWVVTCQGKWDLTCTVFANTIHHLDQILSRFVTLFGNCIQEQEINTTLQAGILGKDWILPSNATRKLSIVGGTQQNVPLDPEDVEILRILANNARMNAIAIAKKTKLTQRQVIYRIKKLENMKVILGYTTSLNLRKLGKQFFKSILYFNTMSEQTRNKLIEFYRSQPEIGFFVFCVGSWPTEIELIVDNNAEYFAIMEKLRDMFPELRGYETLLFRKEHKFDWMPQCYQVANN